MELSLPGAVEGLCRVSGGLLALTDDGAVYNLDRATAAPVSVALRAGHFWRGHIAPRLCEAVWLMGASEFHGSLSLSGSWIGVDEAKVAVFRVDGRLNVPPHALLPACRYRHLNVTIEGEMSVDGVINGMILR